MSQGRTAVQNEDRQRASAIASRFWSIQHGWALGLLCAGCLAAVPGATRAETASADGVIRKLPTDSSIKTDIKKIVAAQLGLRPDQVTDSASLVDLGADSLDTVEFIMWLEQDFELEIPDEECKKLLTVNDSVAYIKARLQQTGASAHP